jgi:hypothetical protein
LDGVEEGTVVYRREDVGLAIRGRGQCSKEKELRSRRGEAKAQQDFCRLSVLTPIREGRKRRKIAEQHPSRNGRETDWYAKDMRKAKD